MTPIIEVQHVTKVYPARRGARDLRGRGGLGDWIRGRKTDTFEALRDVSIAVEPGASLGIIGRNGSGKSTLLKLLAGVTLPSQGEVIVRGRIASLLELGAGFHPILTGRENIYLNAGLLGMRRAQVDQVLDAIIDFSGIREFIDQPVDTYSSGMYVRIAFAVAVHVNPDIFLVDEVLSVGDEEFQRKCRTRIGELREQGKTIVFVSHDLGIVNAICDRVVLLDKGRMINRGSAQATIDFYLRQIGQEKGIHTMASGPLEVVFSHGRASLFLEKREISAPTGIQAYVSHLNQTHNSTMAEWEVLSRDDCGMTAAGLLPRLPVRLLWECRLENNRIIMDFAFECLREAEFDLICIMMHLPCMYDQWFYGGRDGQFPPLLPGHVDWSTVASASPGWSEAVVWPQQDPAYPMIRTTFEASNPYIAINLFNSDYMIGSRVVNVHGRIPKTESTWAAGKHEFVRITYDIAQSREAFLQWKQHWEQQRIINAGPLRARVASGCIELHYNGRNISNSIHLHTQMLIENLWVMSQMFRWGEVRQEAGVLHVSGESQRFPLKQHWQICPVADGIALTIYLEALSDLDVQEYNVSAGLVMQYEQWATQNESGDFPAIEPNQSEYRHLNRDYGVSAWMSAAGAGLPTIKLNAASPENVFHMTAINAEYSLQTRILQAIRTPERGVRLHFPQGRHLLFDGTIISGQ